LTVEIQQIIAQTLHQYHIQLYWTFSFSASSQN